MTGPNPDAELDEALGINQLPPAIVTEEHHRLAAVALNSPEPRQRWHDVAQALADEGQRAVARYIAEHAAAGTDYPEEHPG